jgi:hypothetical protein
MLSNNDSSLSSLLLRKSIIDPRVIHPNCMYKTEKLFNEVSTQVSQSNESKDTQTCYISLPNQREIIPSKSEYRTSRNKYLFINPYAIIDRVNQGEEFLKFLSKQNSKLDLIYTNFLKNLQKYTDHFLLSLQQEHGLYGIYRRDMIR